jgi:hypothetical protein
MPSTLLKRKERTLAEPFKIKMVESLKITTENCL